MSSWAKFPAATRSLISGLTDRDSQTCAALKRLDVDDSVQDEVVDTLAAMSQKMPMGNGPDGNNVLGPLENQNQFDIVPRLVDGAVKRGARSLA
jgi:acyl-CoA reductase-like NAD-dependent aldehyde dehydrogenase